MKTQLEIFEDYLTDAGCFTGKLPTIVEQVMEIASSDVPKRMSATIAVSEIVTFASHLRRNIRLDKETSIPVNAISIVLAPSGARKDSTVNGMRKAFKLGYNLIEEERANDAKAKAITTARAEGKEDPESFHVYNEFYMKPPLLFAGISTEQGLFKHCNRLEAAKLGGGLIYSGEFSTELATNANMGTNIKLSSILYDTGKADVTLLKGEEGQLAPIENLPVSALLVSSFDGILYDEAVKTKFKQEFTSKLARRCILSYTPEEIPLPIYKTAQDLIDATLNKSTRQSATLDTLQGAIDNVTRHHLMLTNKGTDLSISDEARRLYITYQRWGKEKSNTIKIDYPISKITVEHRYWAALKIAGAFAILMNSDEITKDNYIDAINYIDCLSGDLPKFEDELRKDIFEQFINYMHSITVDNKAEVPFHELLKKAYISKGGGITTKVKEMLKLANSKDDSGLYTITETSVIFEKTIKTPTVGVSYIEVPEAADKQARGVAVANGTLTHIEGTFGDLTNLLEMDVAYSAFKFRDGKRKNDNLIPETKWIVLDVDEGVVSDIVAHAMLEDINHHISRTSNPDNPMKYRILIELDAVVSLEPKQWKKFMQAVENLLQIPLDKLPMSQIYYAWSGRDILSVTNKKPLETKHLVLIATEVEEDSNAIDVDKMSKKQKDDLMSAKQDTFWYLYECDNQCSRAMIKAAYHAAALGADVETIAGLLREVNDTYWVMPIAESRFQSTILSQLPAIVAKAR